MSGLLLESGHQHLESWLLPDWASTVSQISLSPPKEAYSIGRYFLSYFTTSLQWEITAEESLALDHLRFWALTSASRSWLFVWCSTVTQAVLTSQTWIACWESLPCRLQCCQRELCRVTGRSLRKILPVSICFRTHAQLQCACVWWCAYRSKLYPLHCLFLSQELC